MFLCPRVSPGGLSAIIGPVDLVGGMHSFLVHPAFHSLRGCSLWCVFAGLTAKIGIGEMGGDLPDREDTIYHQKNRTCAT